MRPVTAGGRCPPHRAMPAQREGCAGILPSATPPSPRGFMGGCPHPDRSSGPGAPLNAPASHPRTTPVWPPCPSRRRRAGAGPPGEGPSASPPGGGGGPYDGGARRVHGCAAGPALPSEPWSFS
ncbi:hypothetical protein STXM2123_5504 [Streptomyces sp. F-3]|nr:hypothetical protein STXM2123_5504 [Streptomyces sp. F-3]